MNMYSKTTVLLLLMSLFVNSVQAGNQTSQMTPEEKEQAKAQEAARLAKINQNIKK